MTLLLLESSSYGGMMWSKCRRMDILARECSVSSAHGGHDEQRIGVQKSCSPKGVSEGVCIFAGWRLGGGGRGEGDIRFLYFRVDTQ